MATRKSDTRGLTIASRAESERPEGTQTLADEIEARDLIIGPKRSSDPADGNPEDGDLAQGTGMIFISDGSAGVTGDDNDVVVAINNGGTINTAVLMNKDGTAGGL